MNRTLPVLLLPLSIGCSSPEPLPTNESPLQQPPDASAAPSVPSVPVENVVGSGTGSVELVTVYIPPTLLGGTDLDFNPARPGELWAVFRELGFEGAPCNETNTDAEACALLEGRVAVISAADSADPRGDIEVDANSWHFMRPSSLHCVR